MAHRTCVLEDHALQVSKVFMVQGTALIALTEFVRNLEAHVFEAHVFASIQTALPILQEWQDC